MKISKEKQEAIRNVIHFAIYQVRVNLHLPSQSDSKLAQLEPKIFHGVKKALGVEEKERAKA